MEYSNLPNNKYKRPTIITIICVWFFIVFAFTLLSIAIPAVRNEIIQQGNLFTIDVLITYILGAIGIIGLWQMKKWGVYFYTAMVAFGTIFSIYDGISFSLGYILPPIIAVIGWIYLNKMR